MISIIIATFNSSRTLAKALESVLEQNFNDWECIIVDGKSTDNTLDIIKEFELKDSRFSHVSEKDNGIYDAFNKGWKHATGEWVYYLGADDELLPNAFRELFVHNYDDYDIIYGNIFRKFSEKWIDHKIAKDPSILKKSFFGSHQGMIMKKSVIEKLGGFSLEYRLKADFALVQKAYLMGYKFKKTPIDFAVFSTGGLTYTKFKIWDWEKYQILKDNRACSFPSLVVFEQALRLLARKFYFAIKGKIKK